MKLVKSKPKYKCDFCRRQSTKNAMEKHEKRCYLNPNRFCDACENTGIATVERAYPPYYGVEYEEVECTFCKKYDRSVLDSVPSGDDLPENISF